MTKRILLVDDDRSIRESLSKILRAENYEVVLGENGQEAIEKHGAERIDLLILDLNMLRERPGAVRALRVGPAHSGCGRPYGFGEAQFDQWRYSP